MKKQYSWLQRGATCSIINTVTTGRCSMISAIISNGEFLCLIVENTGNSENLKFFLYILKYAIEFIMLRRLSEWVFMLDNASIHWSNSTIKLIKEIEIHCKFLPAYSSMLAPVELFFRMVKNKQRANLISQEIWFNNVQGRIEHFKSLQNWSKESIKMMWIQFIKNKKRINI